MEKSRMKPKKPFTKPPLSLASHAGYREAAQKLDELKNELIAHKTEVSKKEQLLIRASSQARQFAGRGALILPSLSEPEFNSIAHKVIAAGMVPKELLGELRSKAPLLQIQDSYDAAILSALNDERATVELLERAIRLQEKELQTQKRSAMQQLNASLRPERTGQIGALTDAVTVLAGAIKEEEAFETWLAGADPDLVRSMRPRLFPTLLLANKELFDWLRQCIEEAVLSPEQIQALEAVGFVVNFDLIGA
jgi:hypothetical protein